MPAACRRPEPALAKGPVEGCFQGRHARNHPGRDLVKRAALLGDVEQAVLARRRERPAYAALRIWSDHDDRPRLDAHLAGADVARDDARHDLRLERTAGRALEVDVLDHP